MQPYNIDEVLVGLLLGDGHLARPNHHNQHNACLSINRKSSDREYQKLTSEIFEDYLTPKSLTDYQIYDKRTKKIYYQSRFRSMCHPYFSEYHNKWYKNRIKIVPKNIVLTPTSVKFWFADDGCVHSCGHHQNQTRLELKLATHAFAYDEVEFLQSSLYNLYSIPWQIITEKAKSNKLQHTLRMWKKDDCYHFLRCIDSDFPLTRKKEIWHNPKYAVFTKQIIPICKFCGNSKVYKNGKSPSGIQKFHCQLCFRQFYGKTEIKFL